MNKSEYKRSHVRELEEEVIRLRDENNSLKGQIDYQEKWSKHLSEHWHALYREIIPKSWYCMSMDSWGCDDEILAECRERLHRPFVQKIVKYDKYFKDED